MPVKPRTIARPNPIQTPAPARRGASREPTVPAPPAALPRLPGAIEDIEFYTDWVSANGLPGRVATLAGPWPVTVTYMKYEPSSLDRPPAGFHDLFIALRTVELLEHLGPRRQHYGYRRASVGFTPRGQTWSITWLGVLEGFGFLIRDEVLRAAGGDLPAEASWRMALSDHAPAIGYLGIEIATQVLNGFPLGRGHVERLLAGFLAMVAKRYSASPERDALRRAGNRMQVERALRYIEDHLHTPFALDDVCHVAGLSSAHINRCFQSEIGTSVWQYVKARRLERARDLLSDTSLSVAQVAAACGFSSASHFTTSFRARYGTSPVAWRSR
jgi:AraC-like DNA-binding protein